MPGSLAGVKGCGVVDLEMAAQDLAGVRVAADLGVRRVELCTALSLGGLTPSIGLVEAALTYAPEVHMLVRPRAGGFAYTRDELDLMLVDIRRVVDAGAAGVVVGALDEAGMPDLGAVAEFVDAAGGVEVTFHRAIDVCADIRAGAQSLLGTGVTRILTSGGVPTAYEGRGVLAELVAICGSEIQVQAAAGINPRNVRAVAETGVAGVHFSAKRSIENSSTRARDGVDFGGYDTIDPAVAEAIIAAVYR